VSSPRSLTVRPYGLHRMRHDRRGRAAGLVAAREQAAYLRSSRSGQALRTCMGMAVTIHRNGQTFELNPCTLFHVAPEKGSILYHNAFLAKGLVQTKSALGIDGAVTPRRNVC